MMRFLIFLFCVSFLNAGIFDAKNAKAAFDNKNYAKAAEIYSNINSSQAKFNQGVSLYKGGNFKDALNSFKSIDDPSLEFNKEYNLGNTYANLGDLENAKTSYEKALKIKDDDDAKHNLEVINRLQKQNEEKQKKQENEQKKDQKEKNSQDNNSTNQNKNADDLKDDKSKDQNKDEKDSPHNQNSGNQNQETNDDKKDSAQTKKEQNSKNNNDFAKASDENKEQKADDQKNNQNSQNDNSQKSSSKDERLDAKENLPPKEEISDMELRKWEKTLNDRGVNTRMLELNTKGDRNEDLKPW